MRRPRGARLTGEAEVKGRLRVGSYADFAVLDEDYFEVEEYRIPHIESVLTVVGGKIVHGAAEHEGLTAPLPEVSPQWSPVAHFGGYQATPAGVTQARELSAAAEDLLAQTRWAQARGGARRRSLARLDDCFL